MAKITVDDRLCKNCLICVTVCPRKVYEVKEAADEGKKIPVPQHPDKCTVCRMCELFCPDFAIRVDE